MRARTTNFFKNEEALGECELPKEFWWAGEDSYHLKRNWVTGDFLTNDPLAGDEWRPWKAYGVQWCKEDAEAMGADFRKAHGDTAQSTTPLGPPISERWPDWVAELCLWIEEANDDYAGLTSGKLIEKINDRLAHKGLEEIPRTTAEPTAKAVLSALRSR